MDRAALDTLYNNRAAVPDHPQDLERWAANSARTREALAHRADIAYGPHPRETLDLYTLPEADGPLLVYIHGGYWQALSKADNAFVAAAFAGPAALANVALLNYPLAPEADMDRIVASIRRAVLFLWREAAPLGFDPHRIFVCGHSAGGHLTAMALLTDWSRLDGAAPADLVKGGISISGLHDLRPIQQTYLNDKLGMDPAVAERNSPLLLLPGFKGPLPPLVCCVGGAETAGFHQQQHDFVTAWQGRGHSPVTAITAPERHHFNIIDTLAQPGQALYGAAAAMLR